MASNSACVVHTKSNIRSMADFVLAVINLKSGSTKARYWVPEKRFTAVLDRPDIS